MLADKLRIRISLCAINFFPGPLHKRPSAGLTNDCWDPDIVAIVRLIHFGGRILNEPEGPISRRENRVGAKSNVSASGQNPTLALQYAMSALPPKADMCAATSNVR